MKKAYGVAVFLVLFVFLFVSMPIPSAAQQESVRPFRATLVTTVPDGTYQRVANFSRDVPAGSLLIITDINARFFTAAASNDPAFFTLWTNPQAGEVNAQTDFAPVPISGSRITRILNAHVELYSRQAAGSPLKVTISRPEGRTGVLTCIISISGRLVAAQ